MKPGSTVSRVDHSYFAGRPSGLLLSNGAVDLDRVDADESVHFEQEPFDAKGKTLNDLQEERSSKISIDLDMGSLIVKPKAEPQFGFRSRVSIEWRASGYRISDRFRPWTG